jgi:hypothetical protein
MWSSERWSSVGGRTYGCAGMIVRDSSLRAVLALAVCAAVLLVAGCGGGGTGGAKALGGSNNTSNCVYTKRFRQGSRLRGYYGQPPVFAVDGVQCVQPQLPWLRTPARPLRRVRASRDGPPALWLQQEGVVVRNLSQRVRASSHRNRTRVLLVPPRPRLHSQLFALRPLAVSTLA